MSAPGLVADPHSPRGAGLRTRLALAFALIAVFPLAVLAVATSALVAERFHELARARLRAALAAAEQRIRLLRVESEAAARMVVEDDWSTAPGDPAGACGRLAEARRLEVLEVVGPDGRVLCSHHWPAGVGLPDPDAPVATGAPWRFETAADGFGSARRLAVVGEVSSTRDGPRITVRAGLFTDAAFLRELADQSGTEVGVRDVREARWIAPSGSPLAGWNPPAAPEGTATLAGRPHDWAAAPLAPGLRLVVAAPHTALESMVGEVRRSTLLIALFALAGALGAAWAVAARLSRPVRTLAEAAGRVAGGDLRARVPAERGDEFGDLARAFNAMTDDLRESRDRLIQAERVAAWREMARRLAHELKNPIFPIQVSVETLRRAVERAPGADPELTALVRDSSATILDELRALLRIVDEFSEFARLPRPEARPTDVNELVERVLRLHEARAQGVGVVRELAAGLPRVPADADLLARALGNLVGNALDALDGTGTLAIRTRATRETVLVEVEDTGPGLAEEQRRRLFTPYFTTKKGGTGLGLAIVQGIVSDHGGRVDVRSAPGQGTTFTVVLPLATGRV